MVEHHSLVGAELLGRVVYREKVVGGRGRVHPLHQFIRAFSEELVDVLEHGELDFALGVVIDGHTQLGSALSLLKSLLE